MTTFVKDADWLDWCEAPTKPTFVLPEGAIDAHCHTFGPGDIFPFAPERKYTPCDASAEQLFALRDFLGFSRNVVVQATCHGANNDSMVDALLKSQGRARGVATVTPDFSTAQLGELHEAGVRGVRFNFVKRLVDPQPDFYYLDIVEKIAPLGWHVVVYFEPADLAERWEFFSAIETPVVVDHMGRPDVTQPIEGPEFGLFLRLMVENERVWTKVSGAERLTKQGAPYSDVEPYARLVVERFSDRVITGTDWPHPNMKTHMPDDGVLVDYISRIAITSELQQALLVDNPARLYWSEEYES